ncbi:hypothetical protein ACNJQJ_21050, partial [Mycobacterium tuberculosis]
VGPHGVPIVVRYTDDGRLGFRFLFHHVTRQDYPDIKVRALLSGPGVMQQLATFCAGGKCPDVLMAWELTYAELADRPCLVSAWAASRNSAKLHGRS